VNLRQPPEGPGRVQVVGGGPEVAARLRDSPSTSDACLIALSGYGQPQDLKASVRAGFDRHFVKPLDLPQLLDVLGHGPRAGQSLH
jgi:CheY-like chemotaxis protein